MKLPHINIFRLGRITLLEEVGDVNVVKFKRGAP
jgi:hypothetical protein